MNDIFNSMRLDERYSDAAIRARSISDQLADLRDIYDALGLPAYADVVSEMADDLTGSLPDGIDITTAITSLSGTFASAFIRADKTEM